MPDEREGNVTWESVEKLAAGLKALQERAKAEIESLKERVASLESTRDSLRKTVGDGFDLEW